MSLDDRLRRVRLLLFDVDGVLTDGRLWVSDDGRTSKAFSIVDGAGIKLAQKAGLAVGFLSGHDSASAVHRARSLGVEICMVGIKDKLSAFQEILAAAKLRAENVLYMGDDLIDLAVLRAAGVAATVPGAHAAVLQVAGMIAPRPGGAGAVRDVIERVLDAQGLLRPMIENF